METGKIWIEGLPTLKNNLYCNDVVTSLNVCSQTAIPPFSLELIFFTHSPYMGTISPYIAKTYIISSLLTLSSDFYDES